MANIFVCGDIIHNNNKYPFIGENLSRVIKDADFAIGNLEGVELDNALQSKTPTQYPGTIDYLSSVGFDMMLMANNHITDKGVELYKNTVAKIEKNKMIHIGAGQSWEEVYETDCIESISGVKVGMVNVCEAQVGQLINRSQEFGYAWVGYDHLLTKVENLSKKVDTVIVFVHAGLEHFELPLPEIRSFYRKLCDAGANCVIGGHPHIVQGYETYNGCFIAYSLGNFYYPHPNGEYPKERNAFSLLLKLEKNKPISIETVHHREDDGVVEIEEKRFSSIDENNLCHILNEDYEQKAEKMCVTAYDTLCRKLLIDALCGEEETVSFGDHIKNVLKRTILRKRFVVSTKMYRDSLLLRLFENETYRNVIIKALRIKRTSI